jgi:hypothetical protein
VAGVRCFEAFAGSILLLDYICLDITGQYGFKDKLARSEFPINKSFSSAVDLRIII